LDHGHDHWLPPDQARAALNGAIGCPVTRVDNQAQRPPLFRVHPLKRNEIAVRETK
jgi:hypothetical protein